MEYVVPLYVVGEMRACGFRELCLRGQSSTYMYSTALRELGLDHPVCPSIAQNSSALARAACKRVAGGRAHNNLDTTSQFAMCMCIVHRFNVGYSVTAEGAVGNLLILGCHVWADGRRHET